MTFSLRVAILVALSASVAGAQVRPDSVRRDTAYRLKEVVITAATPLTTRNGASAIEARLDSMALPSAPSMARVLRDLPFMQVRTNARGEGYFTLRGSGFDAREVAVLIDGVPASLNFDGRADLAVLPATGARSLTLVRGLPSLLYGPNVLGGVVEMDLSRDPSGGASAPGRPAAHLTADVDQRGTYATAASVALPYRGERGTLLIRAGGGLRRSTGFPLPHGVHEPAPFAADETRLNSDRRQGDGFVTARYDARGGAWVALSSAGYDARRGVPSELLTTTPQLLRAPVLQRVFSVASMGTGDRESPLGGHAAVQGSIGVDAARTKLEGYTSRTYTTLKSVEDDNDHNVAARVAIDQSIGSRGDLRSAATYADVRRHEILTPGATSSYRQQLWSGASELGWQLGGGAIGLSSLRASTGVAYDGADTPETGGKPFVPVLRAWGGRAGFAGVALDGNLLVHAGFNKRVRFPALREMYSGTLTAVEPNPGLKPEVLRAAEAGATTRIGGAQLQTVIFHNHITDAIVRSTTPAKKVKRINKDQVTSSGVELLTSIPLGPASLAADLTTQTVNSKDPTTDQVFRPEYQAKFAGGARLATPLLFAMRGEVGSRAVGAQYCLNTAGVYTRLGASLRTDAQVSRVWGGRGPVGRWFAGLETAVAFENLASAAVYDQCGLPQPGRLVRFQVRIR